MEPDGHSGSHGFDLCQARVIARLAQAQLGPIVELYEDASTFTLIEDLSHGAGHAIEDAVIGFVRNQQFLGVDSEKNFFALRDRVGGVQMVWSKPGTPCRRIVHRNEGGFADKACNKGSDG